MDDEVKAFLDGLPPRVREVVSALRAVVRRTAPQAQESVVWGSLSYHRPDVGGRVKGAVCQIVARNEQVRLDFIHGARLADPSGWLRGSRVSKRYIPIESAEWAQRPEVAAMIRAATELNASERA